MSKHFYSPVIPTNVHEESRTRIKTDKILEIQNSLSENGRFYITPLMQVFLDGTFYTVVFKRERTTYQESSCFLKTRTSLLFDVGHDVKSLYLVGHSVCASANIWYSYKFENITDPTGKYLTMSFAENKFSIEATDSLTYRRYFENNEIIKDYLFLVFKSFVKPNVDSAEESFVSLDGGSNHIYILGRKRKIHLQGRTKYVTYNKELIKLSEAKKLDKQRKQ